ncbi:MAG: hypothetical protein CM1200mP41_39300 [Gammaproteobacteria bacterium]|nr:MAG: hypothetical protein CM1200mP41_39300 [Gammaproteobacteria bacterium]
MFPETYALKDQDGILNPQHIAEMYWQLHCQLGLRGPRSRPSALDRAALKR